MKKTVYQYNLEGYLIGETYAYNNILPSNSTAITPVIQEGFIPKFNGTAWEQVENHVGKSGYLFENGEYTEFTIKEYGAVPENFVFEKPPKTLEEAKTEKIAEINSERDRIETSYLTYQNKEYDIDEKSFMRISSAATTAQIILNAQLIKGIDMSNEPYVEWTLRDNSKQWLTYAEMLELSMAVTAHGDIVHSLASDMKEEVNSLETIEQVQSYETYFELYTDA